MVDDDGYAKELRQKLGVVMDWFSLKNFREPQRLPEATIEKQIRDDVAKIDAKYGKGR